MGVIFVNESEIRATCKRVKARLDNVDDPHEFVVFKEAEH